MIIRVFGPKMLSARLAGLLCCSDVLQCREDSLVRSDAENLHVQSCSSYPYSIPDVTFLWHSRCVACSDCCTNFAKFCVMLPSFTAKLATHKINKICQKHNVPLKTAALKFPYLNKNISTVLTGVNSKKQVLENLKSYYKNISIDLWNELGQENLIKIS